MSFRGQRTFVGSDVQTVRGELNRFAGDVHTAFSGVDSALAALSPVMQTITNESTILPTDPIEFSTSPIMPERAGRYLVFAVASGAVVGPDDSVDVELIVDDEVIAHAGTALGDRWYATLVAAVTVTPNDRHTWTVRATTFGGVVTVAADAGGVTITLVEF